MPWPLGRRASSSLGTAAAAPKMRKISVPPEVSTASHILPWARTSVTSSAVHSQWVPARRRSSRLGTKRTFPLSAVKTPPASRHRYRRAARIEITPYLSVLPSKRCKARKAPNERGQSCSSARRRPVDVLHVV